MSSYLYGNEIPMSFERLNNDNVKYLQDFDCDNANINRCVIEDSLSKKTVTYLMIDTKADILVAYCSLACTGVVEQVANIDYSMIPKMRSAIEIEFFAVHKDYRSLKFEESSKRYDTLSSVIFRYCISYAKRIANEMVGAEMLVLYSVPKAVSFYKRSGFTPFRSNMGVDEDPFLKGCVPMHCVV